MIRAITPLRTPGRSTSRRTLVAPSPALAILVRRRYHIDGSLDRRYPRLPSNIEDAVSDAASKGQEAVAAVRDVSDNMVEVIEESLQKRPFTTLAIAAGIGFLIGTTWRR